MIGIFDSGVGGFCAYREVRRLLPREDIVYLADRKNAPYGTKTKDEIISFTKKNIERLKNLGAEKILIACCTASTVFSSLSEDERNISLPIIMPAVKLAAQGKRIAVIATEHTVKTSIFSLEITKIDERCRVFEYAEQNLVSFVESGNRDGQLSEECKNLLLKIKMRASEQKVDSLILGCTHFSHLEGEFKKLLPKVRIISPAREGARELVRLLKTQNNIKNERGRVIYT